MSAVTGMCTFQQETLFCLGGGGGGRVGSYAMLYSISLCSLLHKHSWIAAQSQCI